MTAFLTASMLSRVKGTLGPGRLYRAQEEPLAQHLGGEADTTSSDMWWAHPDSNQGPTGYEPAALPLSYGPTPAGHNIL